MIWSIPGATNPVQLATTMWVMAPSSGKPAIARKAIGLIPHDGAAAFDASTTSGALLSLVRPETLLVVTNSIDNAALARARPGVRAVLVGGELEARTRPLEQRFGDEEA